MSKDVKEFEKKLNELQNEFKDIAELYAANVVLPNWEVSPLIKIRILKKYEDSTKK